MPEFIAEIKPVVWTIASSDSGGGAGIQADLHTFQAMGCHGCSVIAAVTAQNSTQVVGYEPVSTALFITQLNCLIEDMPPKAIKIGLIPNAQLLEQLATWLALHKTKHQFIVIADPVLSSSSGYNFARQSMLSIWRQLLLPLVDLITPNLPELSLLANLQQQSDAQTKQLLQWGANAVLVKGGHDTDTVKVTDHFTSHTNHFTLSQSKIDTPHNHGTGCVLSSAIAAASAHGFDLPDSCIVGRAYLQQALHHSYATGFGAGCLQHHSWPTDPHYFPQLNIQHDKADNRLQFASTNLPVGFYPVIDDIQWLKRLVPLKPDVIQLRIKHGSANDIEQHISQAITLSREYNLRLFINDHWQLAIKYGAYGVHLGQEDLHQADLKAISDAGLRLGISTHSYFEILRARQLNPSYIALGHIFATQTKQMPSQPQGLILLKHYAALCKDIATVAIGGITAERLDAVLKCGISGVAVVSAITAQTDPEQAFLQLKHKVEQHYADYA